ncbi:MAG: PAS domain S-box protein [Proteobacteria bacterium]|nr:PAS domain S-box protein [Pseudomonadota bacterium]
MTIDPDKTHAELVSELAAARVEIAALQAGSSNALTDVVMLRAIADAIPEPVFVKDREGRWLFANAASLRVLGTSLDQLVGKADPEFQADPVMARRVMEMDERVMASGVAEVSEQVMQTPDGDRVFLASKAPLVADGRVIGVVGNARDITARWQAEEAARKSEARARAVIDNMVEGVLVFSGGHKRFANKRYGEILGYTDDELERLEFMASVHPDDRGAVVQVLSTMPDAGTVTRGFECRVVTRAGEVRWLRAKGGRMVWDGEPSVIVFVEDITEQRAAELENRRSEQKLQRVFASMAEGLLLIDANDKIVDCNQSLVRMLGARSPKEIIGRGTHELVVAGDAQVQERRRRAARGEPSTTASYEVRRFDGTTFAAESDYSAVLDDDGARVFMAVTVRDVSERTRQEAERGTLRAALHQAQKMESVGRLAGGVAHDFNNMLAVILATVELAVEQVAPGSPVYEDLSEIRTAAGRSAELTRNLLAFARKQTISLELVDLDATVASMLKLLRRIIGENVQIDRQPCPGLWPLHVDPSQLDQVLTNLCVNARDAITDVGTVTIETTNVSLDAAACAPYPDARPGDYVRLAVRDDGIGMDPDTQLHLFEPFFTTKETGHGTGLGLAMVYGIVKQNRGFIEVQSAVGRGTTIAIHLPRYLGPQEVEAAPLVMRPLQRGGETILLVEDEAAILRVGKRMLEGLGYVVLPAPSPREALRIAQEHVGEIQLLVTDVVMPQMNGRDLASRIRTLRPQVKHLFISGYQANVIANHGVLDPTIHFLPKPFTKESLGSKVREVLDTPAGDEATRSTASARPAGS